MEPKYEYASELNLYQANYMRNSKAIGVPLGSVHHLLRHHQRGGVHPAALARRHQGVARHGPLRPVAVLSPDPRRPGRDVPGPTGRLQLDPVGGVPRGHCVRRIIGCHGVVVHLLHAALLRVPLVNCVPHLWLDAGLLR
ncbi:hypothetical protein HPB51_026543 [Rhipicephalus microplus]|uniref:Uncharacterized protein n=1 Tax=Rhipicephalus microplus TaxID=6941 RepID=A0A9J6D2V1_RHIMP|nr:hypothetical protein HPB51_026543 [Rhipicephalus microplus]